MLKGKDLRWINTKPDINQYLQANSDAQASMINYAAEKSGYDVRFDESSKKYCLYEDDSLIAEIKWYVHTQEWGANSFSHRAMNIRDIKMVNMVFEAIESMKG